MARLGSSDRGLDPKDLADEGEEALVDGDRAVSTGALGALRHRAFRRVFIGAFLSNIGTWMQNVVLGAFAYDLTRSAVFVGVVFFAQLGPILLFSMVGGMLADVLDRRRFLIAVTLEQTVLSVVLAAVVAGGDPNRAAFVGLVFAIGVGHAMYGPAYSALLPSLVGRRDLQGAISLNSAQMNGSRVIGPLIGAFLAQGFGPASVFLLNAATYLFVIGALLGVELPDRAPITEQRGLQRLLGGLRYARTEPIVARSLLTIVTFSLFALAFVGQLPVVAAVNLHVDPTSGAYGALYTCFGLGAMIGALSIGTVFSDRSPAVLARWALVAFGVAVAGLAALRSAAPAFPVLLAVGFAYFAFITSLSTVIQQRLEDHMRGRVMALWMMGFGGTVPVGNLLAGVVIEATSVTVVLLFGAAVAVLLAARLELSPSPPSSLRREEAAPAP